MFDADDLPIPRCCCCGHELHGADGARAACVYCQHRMHDRLNAVEHLWLQLPAYLQRGSRVDTGGRGGSVTPALPLRLDVLALVGPGGIVAELCAIEDDWRRALGFTVQPFRGSADQTLPKVCRFLRCHLGWACEQHQDVDELDLALARIVGQCTAIVSGERRRTIPVECLAEWDDGRRCGAEMRIGAHTLRTICPGCGAEWTRDHLVQLAAGLQVAA
ncbi:hypothetical protein [Kitasatospora kifunensis]|uniref:Putative RNA-binding Zn-ribbon protein involved in translation (DUF1610 family) n=1 Tax=Kitasatospora kifunensis TaxID=58351 RepID=A0A7W7QYJ3_KITKI|nr:hypothetical protein [Kitasatospora kifunensis]MBB4922177.1 putative RNA-binding Zn-ribbon protein involved in translation (DUF1610 family) [Kitasatospora kifunensis]